MSWSPEDHIRHFLYEGIWYALSQQTWESRVYRVLDFGSRWYGDEDGGWRTHMRTMLKSLLGKENLDHVLGTYPEYNIEQLSTVPDDSFDFVIADQVLEHVQRPWLAAQEIHRVCKPGGIAVVATPGLYPIHPSPLDCWRIMPDGYRVLFDEREWEWLKFGQWGTAARVAYEYSEPGGAFPYGPPHRTVEQSLETPGYRAGDDGRCPLQLWLVARKR